MADGNSERQDIVAATEHSKGGRNKMSAGNNRKFCDEILTDLKHYICSATEPTNTSLAKACHTWLDFKKFVARELRASDAESSFLSERDVARSNIMSEQ